MDIIHGLSKLEIETTHSSSQDEEEEEEEEEQEQEQVKRNWLDLPPDVTSLIFMKLGTIGILVSAQWVCTSWWKLSRQPHLFRSIHLEEVLTLSRRIVMLYSTSASKLSKGLAREAIDRSCGQLVEFSVKYIATYKLLHYISQKSNSLRCIRLVSCYRVTDYGMLEMAKKLPQLVELEIIDCAFSKDVFETFGRFCPRLCRLNCVSYFRKKSMFSEVLAAITQNMPELRYLSLFESKFLDDDGLKEILDGCPHLESLDLLTCVGLNFTGDLKERCGNIKVLRLPNDPTDEFEFEQECCNLTWRYDVSHNKASRMAYMFVNSIEEILERDLLNAQQGQEIVY